LVDDHVFLARLSGWAAPVSTISSVCTVPTLLAATGLPEGYRATSSKRALGWRPPTAGRSGGTHEHDGCTIVLGGLVKGCCGLGMTAALTNLWKAKRLPKWCFEGSSWRPEALRS